MDKLETILTLKDFVNKKESTLNLKEMQAMANMLLIIYDSLKFALVNIKEN